MKIPVRGFTTDALLTLPSWNLRPALHCTKTVLMEGGWLQKEVTTQVPRHAALAFLLIMVVKHRSEHKCL